MRYMTGVLVSTPKDFNRNITEYFYLEIHKQLKAGTLPGDTGDSELILENVGSWK
jgi:hypothetical protein